LSYNREAHYPPIEGVLFVSERFSPLTQRVRRILGNNHTRAELVHHNGRTPLRFAPPSPRQLEPSPAFDARLARLSGLLEELRLADRQREAELRLLREQLRASRQIARREVARNLLPLLAEVDVLIALGRTLLDPPPPPPPTTLFERMRARVRAAQQPHEPPAALVTWIDTLVLLRSRIEALIEEGEAV
jgi:hypothetical protein